MVTCFPHAVICSLGCGPWHFITDADKEIYFFLYAFKKKNSFVVWSLGDILFFKMFFDPTNKDKTKMSQLLARQCVRDFSCLATGKMEMQL